jgi:hypothetical protein
MPESGPRRVLHIEAGIPVRWPRMQSYVATVGCNEETKWWRADVPNIPGASSTARTSHEFSAQILAATALVLDVEESEINVSLGGTNA